MLSPLLENWQPIRDDCKQFLSIIPNKLDTASSSVLTAQREMRVLSVSPRARVSAASGLLWTTAGNAGPSPPSQPEPRRRMICLSDCRSESLAASSFSTFSPFQTPFFLLASSQDTINLNNEKTNLNRKTNPKLFSKVKLSRKERFRGV